MLLFSFSFKSFLVPIYVPSINCITLNSSVIWFEESLAIPEVIQLLA